MRIRSRAPAAAAAALVAVVLLAGTASAASWRFETLDRHEGGPDGRISSDLGGTSSVVQYLGAPHVWYHDVTNGNLRHGWWTGSTWRFETLDGHQSGPSGQVVANVGATSLVALYADAPHVWYHDVTNGNLRHGWWTGSTWRFETLDGHQSGPTGQVDTAVGDTSSVAFHEGAPHVWHHDVTNGNLRHGWWTGTTWRFETLDGHESGPDGQVSSTVGYTSSTVSYGGAPHVFYWDSVNGHLRHAWWTGSTWRFEALDGHQSGPTGQIATAVGYSSSVLLHGGVPHVWYRDYFLSNLRHGWWTGTAWHFETLDGHQSGPTGQINADLGYDSALALFAGAPHVWYWDFSSGDLRHGWWTGSTWRFETLDGHQSGPSGQVSADVGDTPSATVYAGEPHVWYRDSTSGNLRHAWYG